MRFLICELGWGKGKRRPGRMAGLVKTPDLMLALVTRHGQALYPCSVRAMRALDEDRWARLGESTKI